ncbi:hypothetical protein M878_12535, partial [Streptomyces roseochromogenus subsp. oscitans DS 12.976]
LSRAALDTPRGHDEQDPAHTSRMPRVDDRQGPGSTAEIPRIDDQGPSAAGQFARPENPQQTGQFARQDSPQQTGQYARPDSPQQTGEFARPDASELPGRYDGSGGGQQDSGQFVRSDVFSTPAPRPDDLPRNTGPNSGQNTGQFAAPQGFDGGYDGSSTGQHALPGRQDPAHTGQFERPQPAGRDDFGAPRPPAPQQRPAHREPEALPPANGPLDGRTPLYDTLETNWFHGGPQESAPAPAQPQQPQAPAPAPQRGFGGNQNGNGGNPNANGNGSATGSWRTSPNDELVRQAERVRQPAAGGVTTSGLPRRVPRANLVPGTAQQQHQAGPQVSRAPDDVRGRLTNLRRGIAQGRQAGSGQTGSYPSPTHQQER